MRKFALVLEDESSIRSMVENILLEHGYLTRAFASPAEIIGTQSEEIAAGPDIIISDNHMPHVTGLEYIRNLQQSGKSVCHIAMMSGYWQPDELKEAESLGCKIFHKPFSIITITEWVRSVSGS